MLKKQEFIRREGRVASLFFLLFLLSAAGVGVRAEGVTILTHGFQAGTGESAWVAAMRDAVSNACLSGEKHYGTITVTGSAGSLTATCSPWDIGLATSTSGEILIVVDWSAVANHLVSGVTAQEVAAAVAPKIFQGQNGHPALAELPLHLMGHSRGGGMICELARLLGLQGVEVDQLTTLDPHPLTASDPQPPLPLPSIIDTPMAVYENVLFTDNYWQTIAYPQGQSIAGAYNRLWTSLPGGYHNHSDSAYNSVADHLNIHLLYHGTVDLNTPISDGQATLGSSERTAWFNAYESEGGTGGQKAGFFYSRIGLYGNRLSTDTPVAGGDALKNGYHNDALLGGAGARSPQTWTSAVWPNVVALEVLRGSTPLGPGVQGLSVGETLTLRYTYRDYDSGSDVTFYVDQDRNPYNNNNLGTIATRNLSATGPTLAQATEPWNSTGISPVGEMFVYAKITDGSRTRYLYAFQSFEIAPGVEGWQYF